ncbi:MAG: hypothetical protein CMQ46_05120 [Gammaproteobacteria bacterium]|nr:hypothetical protein [Gammaproteobacteria bacterium]MBJ54629.1 hypothetical protein [Gammaproteobacteria bacterium]|tara:strand:- start:31 stop:318 length:288 start_codon:yes stop_codon:yes gene_type:complete
MTLRAANKDSEITDHTWDGLIRIALKYQGRMGRYHNIRYDRKHLYIVLNVRQLASILVDKKIISSWPAGFTRLTTIEEAVIREFKKLHGKTHLDT